VQRILSKSPMDISIIIVSWNTREITCQCLRSIYDRPAGYKFEVIVADNASTDGSVGMIKEKFPQVHLMENKENKGFAAANNQGIKTAQGKYLLLLNSDTEIIDDAIAKTIKFADTQPEAAVVGCRVLNPDRTLQPTCFKFPSLLNLFLAAIYLYKIFPGSRFFGRERMSWWDRKDEREVDVVTGCFMLVRKEAIEQVGLLDESFFMYGEETDWCWRFKKAGWKILFTPEAQIVHYGGQSSKKAATDMSLQLRGSILKFVNKHNSRPYYICACFFVWLFFILRIPFWFLKWLFVKHNRELSRQQMMVYVKAVWRIICGGGEKLCVNK